MIGLLNIGHGSCDEKKYGQNQIVLNSDYFKKTILIHVDALLYLFEGHHSSEVIFPKSALIYNTLKFM